MYSGLAPIVEVSPGTTQRVIIIVVAVVVAITAIIAVLVVELVRMETVEIVLSGLQITVVAAVGVVIAILRGKARFGDSSSSRTRSEPRVWRTLD